MILTNNESVSTLMETLQKEYYEPRGLSDDVHVFRPVEGSGTLSIA